MSVFEVNISYLTVVHKLATLNYEHNISVLIYFMFHFQFIWRKTK